MDGKCGGGRLVKSRLFTSQEQSLVTFEEFSIFCGHYGLNPCAEAMKIDWRAYLKMQLADFILNNNDRHQQNWGFFMENDTGKLLGYVPLFELEKPELLEEEAWQAVLRRCRKLS